VRFYHRAEHCSAGGIIGHYGRDVVRSTASSAAIKYTVAPQSGWYTPHQVSSCGE
jgi:hypothetical protein